MLVPSASVIIQPLIQPLQSTCPNHLSLQRVSGGPDCRFVGLLYDLCFAVKITVTGYIDIAKWIKV